MAGSAVYQFVALEHSTDRNVLLDIRPHDDRTQAYLKDISQKMSLAVQRFHQHVGKQIPGWADWKVAEWSQKNIPERQKFAAWAGDVLAGYIWVRGNFPSVYQPPRQILYVEIMAATPTNLSTDLWNRRLGYVGSALLGFAVSESIKQGFEGFFGLHAADATAAEYYRNMNQDRQGELFEEEKTGITGVPPRGEEAKNSPYFESKVNGALELLKDYQNG